jgi:DNA-binding transcriptional MerR regulator
MHRSHTGKIMSKKPLRTGEVAAKAEVSIATLRYYERRGLIAPPARSASGYRAYPPETVQTVRLIRRMQRLGFTLEEILALLELRLAPGATCADVYRAAEAKVADLDRQISELSESRAHLVTLLDLCPRKRAVHARLCPILTYLEDSTAR